MFGILLNGMPSEVFLWAFLSLRGSLNFIETPKRKVEQVVGEGICATRLSDALPTELILLVRAERTKQDAGIEPATL